MLKATDVVVSTHYWASGPDGNTCAEEPELLTEARATILNAELRDGEWLVPTRMTVYLPLVGPRVVELDDHDHDMAFYHENIVVNGEHYSIVIDLYLAQ